MGMKTDVAVLPWGKWRRILL